MERTLVLIKPDATKRNIIGKVITRLENRGLKIINMNMPSITADQAREHYKDHVDKPFYPKLEVFITSGPVVAMIVWGENAVEIVRSTIGSTNCAEAAPGTIRGDFGTSLTENIIHGSDSIESADREIDIFFGRARRQGDR